MGQWHGDLALKLSYSVKGKAPQLRLVGTVTQSDVDRDFSALVPVEIELARGQTITQWVRTGSEAATFTVPLTQAPVKVLSTRTIPCCGGCKRKQAVLEVSQNALLKVHRSQ